jgi:large subunit ribosomal protein L15
MKKKLSLTKKKPAVRKTSRKKAVGLPKETAKEAVLAGLNILKAPKGSHKRRKLLGRGSGSGHGKTSTRGSKGQTSRSGRDFYLGFEGGQMPLIRKIPKRGFTSRFRKEYQIVNLNDLSRIKESVITPALLKENGLIKDQAKLIKILADGQIKNAATIQAHAFSKKALEKIRMAGGKIEVINA